MIRHVSYTVYFNLFNYLCLLFIAYYEYVKICATRKQKPKYTFSHFLALLPFPTNQVFNENKRFLERSPLNLHFVDQCL